MGDKRRKEGRKRNRTKMRKEIGRAEDVCEKKGIKRRD